MHTTAWVTIVVLLVLVTGTTFTLLRAMGRLQPAERRPAPTSLPPLLVIRPVRGIDHGLEANVAAALSQEYPGPMETLFIVDEESDPALEVISRTIEERGADARVLLAEPLLFGRTGKLHAMICAMADARVDAPLICFADSDTRPGRTLLRDLASVVVSSPAIGAAFARAVCAEPAETGWDVGHSLMLDALYGPQAALAMTSDESLPFIMGQTVVLRRSALYAAGGLEASQGQLVDDMHIGRRMAAAGYRNVLTAHAIPLAQAGLSWPSFHALAVRWITYSRTGIPFWPFNVPTIVLTVGFLLGVLGTVLGLLSGMAAIAAGYFACAASAALGVELLRRRHGGGTAGLRSWWAVPLCLALLPLFFARARLVKSIEWRGRSYSLDDAGSLAAS